MSQRNTQSDYLPDKWLQTFMLVSNAYGPSMLHEISAIQVTLFLTWNISNWKTHSFIKMLSKLKLFSKKFPQMKTCLENCWIFYYTWDYFFSEIYVLKFSFIYFWTWTTYITRKKFSAENLTACKHLTFRFENAHLKFGWYFNYRNSHKKHSKDKQNL